VVLMTNVIVSIVMPKIIRICHEEISADHIISDSVDNPELTQSLSTGDQAKKKKRNVLKSIFQMGSNITSAMMNKGMGVLQQWDEDYFKPALIFDYVNQKRTLMITKAKFQFHMDHEDLKLAGISEDDLKIEIVKSHHGGGHGHKHGHGAAHPPGAKHAVSEDISHMGEHHAHAPHKPADLKSPLPPAHPLVEVPTPTHPIDPPKIEQIPQQPPQEPAPVNHEPAPAHHEPEQVNHEPAPAHHAPEQVNHEPAGHQEQPPHQEPAPPTEPPQEHQS